VCVYAMCKFSAGARARFGAMGFFFFLNFKIPRQKTIPGIAAAVASREIHHLQTTGGISPMPLSLVGRPPVSHGWV